MLVALLLLLSMYEVSRVSTVSDDGPPALLVDTDDSSDNDQEQQLGNDNPVTQPVIPQGNPVDSEVFRAILPAAVEDALKDYL